MKKIYHQIEYLIVDIINDEYISTNIRFNRPLERAD